MSSTISIIGAGLAGSEVALQLADHGWEIQLYEMRPLKSTPAHQTGLCAEIVCSNSFKSDLLANGSGLLKAEMRLMNCKLLAIAESCRVDAGSALAVDRLHFAEKVSCHIKNHPNIHYHEQEITNLDGFKKTVIATGPLTSDALTTALIKSLGEQALYFFDAIAPIVATDSLNDSIIFEKARYDKGSPDYLNIPFNKEEYYNFVHALQTAEKHEAHEFENVNFQNLSYHFYENCMPIEELARRGDDTLSFGVMRPVGLEDPRTGKRAYAVIQLRAENQERTSYNLVGCQTMLKYGEQKKVFSLIPGLQNAEFLRFGSIHRNTFLHSPALLNSNLSLRCNPNFWLAGQISGVEGYVESIWGGLVVARSIMDKSIAFPTTTISGQLLNHLLIDKDNYQPMNANFGLLPDLPSKIRDKRMKKEMMAERGINDMKAWLSIIE